MANEVVKKEAGSVARKPQPNGALKDIIKGEAFKGCVSSFFSDERNRERFLQVAVNATVKTPALLNCDRNSFLNALMQLASFGLNPDGRNAHMIPYGKVCTLIIDYKGLVTLALRSPRVSKVEAFAVHQNDTFRLTNGEVEHVVDNPFGDRGDVIGYYAVCQFSDGAKKYEVMSKAEVDAVRKRSRAANNGPWVTDYDEMAKKTVFKRLTKWLPVTPELTAAVQKDDEDYENGETKRTVRKVTQDIDFGDEGDGEEDGNGEVLEKDDGGKVVEPEVMS